MSQITLHKKNILERIENFMGLDLEKVYSKGPNYISWNNLDPDDIEAYIKNIVFLLSSIRTNIDIFDNGLQIGFLQNLDSYILNAINSYNNAGLKHLHVNDISNQHHDFLNQSQNILNTLWSSPYYLILRHLSNFTEVPKDMEKDVITAQIHLSKFIESKNDIDGAISSAKSWLQNRNKMEEEVIKKQAGEYDTRAKEHKTYGDSKILRFIPKGAWLWGFASFIFALLTAFITYSFYDSAKNDTSISIGSALLHISTIIVPAYLTVFSSTQFLFHKKMYESYKFKYASLLTMNYLLDLNKNDSSKTEKILNKGLDVLFSEPSIREDSGKIDKTIVTELIKLATSGSKAV